MRLMDLKNAGEVLGITARQLRTVWLRTNKYNCRSFFKKIGRDWKITEKDFESFVNQIPTATEIDHMYSLEELAIILKKPGETVRACKTRIAEKDIPRDKKGLEWFLSNEGNE